MHFSPFVDPTNNYSCEPPKATLIHHTKLDVHISEDKKKDGSTTSTAGGPDAVGYKSSIQSLSQRYTAVNRKS